MAAACGPPLAHLPLCSCRSPPWRAGLEYSWLLRAAAHARIGNLRQWAGGWVQKQTALFAPPAPPCKGSSAADPCTPCPSTPPHELACSRQACSPMPPSGSLSRRPPPPSWHKSAHGSPANRRCRDAVGGLVQGRPALGCMRAAPRLCSRSEASQPPAPPRPVQAAPTDQALPRPAHLAQLRRGQRLIQQVPQQGAAHSRQLRPNLVRTPRQQFDQALVRRRTGGQAPLRRRALRQPACARRGSRVGQGTGGCQIDRAQRLQAMQCNASASGPPLNPTSAPTHSHLMGCTSSTRSSAGRLPSTGASCAIVKAGSPSWRRSMHRWWRSRPSGGGATVAAR